MKINRKPNKKKVIALVIVMFLVAGGVYAFVASRAGIFPFERPASDSAEIGEQKVSLERSDAEEADINAIADNPSLKNENDQTDTPKPPVESTENDKLKVNVLLTNVRVANGTISASGFVTNLVEADGTCSYIFTKGPLEVAKTARTLTNPTSTTCETVRFSTDELTADGTWSVSVAYNSSAASGESEKKEFTK
jgi:hypothetical protein